MPIDVHGSLDRAKDVSSFGEPLLRRHHDECVRLAHADDVPLLISPEDTRCRRCVRRHGNEPHEDQTDRSRFEFRRPPAKADDIARTRVPFTVATWEGRGFSSAFPRRPPAHAAHTLSPWLGQSAFEGIASTLPGITQQEYSRVQDTFLATSVLILANPRLG